MITQIKLCLKHRLKVKGSPTLRFQPGVNVLIGPNGSGKSTVLRALHSCPECLIENPNSSPTLYFNPETMNPHHPDYYPSDVREMILKTRGIFSSHGEILRAALFSLPIREGSVFLVDEPETGQDIEGVGRIREGFDKIVASGGQVIAATHHPLIMRDANIIELVPGYAEYLHHAICQPASPTSEKPEQTGGRRSVGAKQIKNRGSDGASPSIPHRTTKK